MLAAPDWPAAGMAIFFEARRFNIYTTSHDPPLHDNPFGPNPVERFLPAYSLFFCFAFPRISQIGPNYSNNISRWRNAEI